MMKKLIEKKGDIFWPNKEMKKIAWVSDSEIYEKADKDPVKFWEKLASEGISWKKNWKKGYEERLPYFKWFVGGELNVSYNCLDRHLKDKGDETALIWVPEPTNEKTIKLTYKELYEKVNKTANFLKKLGVKKGDVVAIYMPMIPEVVISMLACTRIGAIHSVVFSAFSADALKTRLEDEEAKILITSDGYYRRGSPEDLKKKADEAVEGTSVKKIIVVSRIDKSKKYSGKYVSWSKIEREKAECDLEFVESNEPMFILYTSGTTGKPKGVVHDTGGYLVQAHWTAKWNFDLHDGDVMWCTADVGWITGHTYAVYGPLSLGVTSLIYEGAPDFPDFGRWWKIIDDNKVNVFYTAPTAIRMFRKAGEQWLQNYKLDSLKMLGTVGEPIDDESWMWYFDKVGKSRCPLVDTWWQTETGGNLINSLPGIGPFIPTVAGKSFPGTRHLIVDDNGKEVKAGVTGYLVQKSPFAPGMIRDIWKSPEKYQEKYWDKFKGYYDTSDGAYQDKEGHIRLTGRVDDVMKVAGHRLATAELENAIDENEFVDESAVVPMPDEVKGQVPIAFVVLKKGQPSEELEKQIKKHVDEAIGPIARPAKIYFVEDLPKTRSGKIMRRILKNVLSKEEPEGLMTLFNPECIENIKGVVEEAAKVQQAKK